MHGRRQMSKEFVLYCDESTKRGAHFSNFYGGALVRSADLEGVRQVIAEKKMELNLGGEVKWEKITSPYRDKYTELIGAFFDLVRNDTVKVRIMFTQNRYIPVGLSKEQIENSYFLLYYQFIKHAFGLTYNDEGPANLRLYFDRLPDTKEKVDLFKSYILRLRLNPQFVAANICIRDQDIADVISHDHDILQCVDIVLGAMQFRLNDLHKAKIPGTNRRGKRTVAKEYVYKAINERIRDIYPGFNIGISTGVSGDRSNRWRHPYRHWLFVPEEHQMDDSFAKP